MSDELGWPTAIQFDLATFEIHSPPVIMREFAGVYGELHGFTTQTNDENDADFSGVREFAVTNQQDAFRHAFVHGVRALENWDHERSLNSLPLSPVTKTNEQLFDSVSDNTLW